MRSEYKEKENDNEAKLLNIMTILHEISESVYNNEEDRAMCRLGVEAILKRSAEKIRTNRANYKRAMFIEEFLVDPTQQCSWNGAKWEFIKIHYFWDVFQTNQEMKALIHYMKHNHSALWSSILKIASDRQIMIKPPEKQHLPVPKRPGTDQRDINYLDGEEICCKVMKRLDNPSPNRL